MVVIYIPGIKPIPKEETQEYKEYLAEASNLTTNDLNIYIRGANENMGALTCLYRFISPEYVDKLNIFEKVLRGRKELSDKVNL